MLIDNFCKGKKQITPGDIYQGYSHSYTRWFTVEFEPRGGWRLATRKSPILTSALFTRSGYLSPWRRRFGESD